MKLGICSGKAPREKSVVTHSGGTFELRFPRKEEQQNLTRSSTTFSMAPSTRVFRRICHGSTSASPAEAKGCLTKNLPKTPMYFGFLLCPTPRLFFIVLGSLCLIQQKYLVGKQEALKEPTPPTPPISVYIYVYSYPYIFLQYHIIFTKESRSNYF